MLILVRSATSRRLISRASRWRRSQVPKDEPAPASAPFSQGGGRSANLGPPAPSPGPEPATPETPPAAGRPSLAGVPSRWVWRGGNLCLLSTVLARGGLTVRGPTSRVKFP